MLTKQMNVSRPQLRPAAAQPRHRRVAAKVRVGPRRASGLQYHASGQMLLTAAAGAGRGWHPIGMCLPLLPRKQVHTGQHLGIIHEKNHGFSQDGAPKTGFHTVEDALRKEAIALFFDQELQATPTTGGAPASSPLPACLPRSPLWPPPATPPHPAPPPLARPQASTMWSTTSRPRAQVLSATSCASTTTATRARRCACLGRRRLAPGAGQARARACPAGCCPPAPLACRRCGAGAHRPLPAGAAKAQPHSDGLQPTRTAPTAAS
jgi:hypothetical protein